MSRFNARRIVKNLLRPGDGLSHRVFSGGFWTFGMRGTQLVFNMIRLIILARILSPNDFGLMGVALLTMAVLETFSQTGFQAALIQKKEDIKSYLNAAWTVLILRGLILFTVLYFIAPFTAAFFETPAAEPIMQVIGLSILLQAFTNIGVIYFQKELEFNKQYVFQLSGTVADFIVAVSSVLILQSVWALVFGLLAGNAVRCVVSYLIHPYRPRLSSEFGKAKELWGFGKWVLGFSALLFLINQGVDIFVGKILGAAALGIYQMAYLISNMPATEITNVISQVTFPAYSKLQADMHNLRNAYMRTLEVTALLSFPIAGLIFVATPDFTTLILGEKWIEIILPMQILAIWGAVSAMAGVNGSILMAVKRPDVVTKLSLIKLVILAIMIYPFSMEWGLLGTCLVVLLSSIAITPNTYFIVVRRILGCPMTSVLKRIAIPMVGTITMGIVTWFLMLADMTLLTFIIVLLVGLICYFFTTYFLEKITGLRTWDNIIGILRDLSK